jgi:hypothetical protein
MLTSIFSELYRLKRQIPGIFVDDVACFSEATSGVPASLGYGTPTGLPVS